MVANRPDGSDLAGEKTTLIIVPADVICIGPELNFVHSDCALDIPVVRRNPEACRRDISRCFDL
jgi:hypothetical protein